MAKQKVYVSWEDVFHRLAVIDKEENVVYGIPKGGMLVSAFLKKATVTHHPEDANLLLDDIVDSGATRKRYLTSYPNKRFFAIVDKQLTSDEVLKQSWVVFPWETEVKELGPTDAVTRLIEYVGDDPGKVTRGQLIDCVLELWEMMKEQSNENEEDQV